MKRFWIVLTIITILAFPAYADVTIGGGVSSDSAAITGGSAIFNNGFKLQGPASISAFSGTVSAGGGSASITFSSAADAILAGYSATTPVVGAQIIAGGVTRYIQSWTNATTAVVGDWTTWAVGTAITSIQLPVLNIVNSAGAILGGVNSVGNFWIGSEQRDSKMYIRQALDADMYIRMHPGLTTEQRAYFSWQNLAGANRWLMGKNGSDYFILFESATGVHRLRMFSVAAGGQTDLTSVSTGAVRINYVPTDLDADLGSGGLEVYGGGLNPQKLFFATSNGVGITSPVADSGGGYVRKVVNAVSAALSGASGSIAVNVPAGARILGIQLRVDTAITSGDGATSWAAAYVNTPTTAICSGQAFTKSTRFNAVHPAYEITTGTVTITITPNSGTFSAGVVRAIVYYEALDAMAAAP